VDTRTHRVIYTGCPYFLPRKYLMFVSLKDYINQAHSDVDKFYAFWVESEKEMPGSYSSEGLTAEDWEEQFLAWMDIFN